MPSDCKLRRMSTQNEISVMTYDMHKALHLQGGFNTEGNETLCLFIWATQNTEFQNTVVLKTHALRNCIFKIVSFFDQNTTLK